MKALITAIAAKQGSTGIQLNPPAGPLDIAGFEQITGLVLPPDFRDFYTVCNGLECIEDIFNILPLTEIAGDYTNYRRDRFFFAEYMIWCDSWGVRFTEDGRYEIFNASYPEIALTDSLYTFLNHVLEGHVFEPNGLYDWQQSLGIGLADRM